MGKGTATHDPFGKALGDKFKYDLLRTYKGRTTYSAMKSQIPPSNSI